MIRISALRIIHIILLIFGSVDKEILPPVTPVNQSLTPPLNYIVTALFLYRVTSTEQDIDPLFVCHHERVRGSDGRCDRRRRRQRSQRRGGEGKGGRRQTQD